MTYVYLPDCWPRSDLPVKFFIGRELNPSIGSLDIKYFNELRPGLILWVLIDISMACEQATRRGDLAKVTDSMWLVLAFQAFYVVDALYNEVSFALLTEYTPLNVLPARRAHNDGHHHRRLWLHARRWRPTLGSVYVFSPSTLSGLQAGRTRPRMGGCDLDRQLHWLLHLP